MNDKALTVVQKNAIEFREYINKPQIKNQLAAALPRWLSPDRMLRVLMTEMMKNPKLFDCTRESVLSAVIQCAQLGLEPVLGRAYLVPYKNICQFIPGYQGLIDLARRSGTISDVYAEVVYDNDEFDLVLGSERKIHHRPYYLRGHEDHGLPIGAYCIWILKDGTQHPSYMPINQIYKRRDKSPAFKFGDSGDRNKGGGKKDSVWHVWEEEMIKKTVVKNSAKFVPASIEFMEAVQIDNEIESLPLLYPANEIEVPAIEPPPEFETKGAMKRYAALAQSDPDKILECLDMAGIAEPENDEQAAEVLKIYDGK